MEDIKSLIGLRIRQLRKEQSISQEQLALLSGLDRTYINSVENGKRNISIVNIQRLALSLNCNLECFFTSQYFKEGDNNEQR